jgi:hypothetical protein
VHARARGAALGGGINEVANMMGPVTAGRIDSTAGSWQWAKEGMLRRLHLCSHSCCWHSQCPTC